MASRFWSYAWDNENDVLTPGQGRGTVFQGEQLLSPRPWNNGKERIGAPKALNYCGSRSQWLGDLVLSRDGQGTLNSNGFPSCCIVPDIVFFNGGIVLGGSLPLETGGLVLTGLVLGLDGGILLGGSFLQVGGTLGIGGSLLGVEGGLSLGGNLDEEPSGGLALGGSLSLETGGVALGGESALGVDGGLVIDGSLLLIEGGLALGGVVREVVITGCCPFGTSSVVHFRLEDVSGYPYVDGLEGDIEWNPGTSRWEFDEVVGAVGAFPLRVVVYMDCVFPFTDCSLMRCRVFIFLIGLGNASTQDTFPNAYPDSCDCGTETFTYTSMAMLGAGLGNGTLNVFITPLP